MLQIIGNGYSSPVGCSNEAWAAGMAHVDVYVFMCPNCDGNNPPDQIMNNIVNQLTSDGVKYGMLWMDVEQCDGW